MIMEKQVDYEIKRMFACDREGAFRLFFDSYYLILCNYVLLLTDDFEESKDIVQSFFVQFWENHLENSVTGSFRNYALICVRNAAIKRNKDRENWLSLQDSLEFLSETDQKQQEDIIQKEQRVIDALRKLSAQELHAVTSVLMEEKKYADAAAELNISVNTLKTYLKRAVKKLKELLILSFSIFLSPIF